jgi:hypothetical protein
MAKRNLSKKPKRKQLSRKLKRKTLNRKKGGTRDNTRFAYPGDSSNRTRNTPAAEESFKNICFGLILFVVIILIPAAASAAYTPYDSEHPAYGGATFQLPEDLILCINNKTRFNDFLEKVIITDNILTIKDLTRDDITKLEKDDLLNKYIEVNDSKISFNIDKISQTQDVIEQFIYKISASDPQNNIVDIDCINEKLAKIFENK